jgi:hypothetical protein
MTLVDEPGDRPVPGRGADATDAADDAGAAVTDATAGPVPAGGLRGAVRPEQLRERRPRPRWYRRVPPVEVPVECSGGTHQLRWRRGAFVALAHDVEAERAMHALGGERVRCLELVDVWRDAVTGRRPPDTFDLPADLRRVATLARLVRVERRWSDPALPDGERRVALDRLVSRFREAVAASLAPSRRQRGLQRIEVNVRPVPSGERIGVEAQTAPDRIRLQVQLGLAWNVQVAGRGLGAVDDAVVLDVVDHDRDTGALGVIAVRWEVPRPRLVVPQLVTLWAEPSGDGSWSSVQTVRPVRTTEMPWWSVSAR